MVHWRTADDADASMARFATDPAAQEFMASIDATSMSMERYQVVALRVIGNDTPTEVVDPVGAHPILAAGRTGGLG